MKNSRNIKINDLKNKRDYIQKEGDSKRNTFSVEINILENIFKFYILKCIMKIDKNLPFSIYFKIVYIVYIFDEIERK